MAGQLFTILLLATLSGMVMCRHDPPVCSGQGAELWPHDDVNLYWYCANQGSTPVALPCPPNSGFVRNNEQHGCVPFYLWECSAHAIKPNCWLEEPYNRPQRHANPNKFWACSEDRQAVELDCQAGRGFTNNGMTNPQKPFGCVPWPAWSHPDCRV